MQPLPQRSSRTHQSAGGHERLRDPGGEWAAGERARGSQFLAPGHGAGRGEHGSSPAPAPEGPLSNGSCGHHQPGGEVGRSHRGAGSGRKNSEGGGVRQQEKGVKEAGELGMGEGASATHPGRCGQPQCDCGQQGHCRQGERGQRGLLPPQPLAQERLPWGAGRGHWSQTSTLGMPFPEHPRGSGGAAQTRRPQPGQDHLLRGGLSLRTAPRRVQPARPYLRAQDGVGAVLTVVGGAAP